MIDGDPHSSSIHSGYRWISLNPLQIGSCKLNTAHDKIAILSSDNSVWRKSFAEYRSLRPYEEIYQVKSLGSVARDIFDSLENSPRLAETLNTIDELLHRTTLEHAGPSKSARDRWRRFASLVITIARDADLLIIPLYTKDKISWRGGAHPISNHHLLETLHGFNEGDQIAGKILLGCLHIPSPTDLTESVIEAFWKHVDLWFETRKISPLISGFNTALRAIAERAKTSNPDYEFPKYKRTDFQKKGRLLTDNDGWWAIDPAIGNPRFIEWKTLFSDWLNSLKISKTRNKNGSARAFVRYLSTQLPNTLSPADIRTSDIFGSASQKDCFINWMSEQKGIAELTAERAILHLREFFDWWYQKYGIERNHVSRNPFLNSLPLRNQENHLSKSEKECIPVTIIRELREIISENNFEFPKSLSICWCRRQDPDSKEFVDVFNPSLSHLLLLLLEIPVRKIQARLLDSGEADETVFDINSFTWVTNDHPLAKPGRQLGVIKRFRDRGSENREFVGFFINSKKGAWSDRRSSDAGYSIPWQNERLITYLCQQAAWQRKWNPIEILKSRRDLECKQARIDGNVGRLEQYAFLFRRVGTPSDNELISNATINRFWVALLRECERRLRERGWKDIELTIAPSSENSDHINPLFTIHCLRVSGITHFVESGLPIHVTAEFISGHASIMMALYYTKVHPEKTRKIIEDAVENLENCDEDEYFEELIRGARGDGGTAFLFGSSAKSSILNYEPPHWVVMIDGICPVGGAMCQSGGEYIGTFGKNEKFQALPRDAFSCALCRFRVTGPAFLNGQIVVFNNLLFSIQESTRFNAQIQSQLDQLISSNASNRSIKRKKDELDQLESSLDNKVKALQSRASEIYGSLDLLNSGKSVPNSKHQLITRMSQGDIHAAVENSTAWDLTEFAAQTAEFLPLVAPSSATLQKNVFLDKMLDRNGYKPFSISLSEDHALRAGNLLTSLLEDIIGRQALSDLMQGDIDKLEDLGIDEIFRDIHDRSRAESLNEAPVNVILARNK